MATTPSTRRAPRRLHHEHPALETLRLSSGPPPEDSFAWQLWMKSQDLAHEALRTDYIGGIAGGTLEPDIYGRYTVQDAVYCHHAEQDYRLAEKRARAVGEEEVAAFAQAHHESYQAYWKQTFSSWSIVKPGALMPSPAMERYVEVERKVAAGADPIYTVVAMLPCDALWAWLAEQLAASVSPTNLYSSWIVGNTGFTGAYHLNNFVNQWLAAHPGGADPETALAIFRACMTCEVNAFRAACGETLLPMPDLPSF